jgi:hypothetical protein
VDTSNLLLTFFLGVGQGLKTSIGRFLEWWKVPFGYHSGRVHGT